MVWVLGWGSESERKVHNHKQENRYKRRAHIRAGTAEGLVGVTGTALYNSNQTFEFLGGHKTGEQDPRSLQDEVRSDLCNIHTEPVLG